MLGRSAARRALVSINPKTNEVIRTFQEMTPTEVNGIVELSHKASMQWSSLSAEERASRIKNVASELRANKEECATLIHEEMGKPMREAIAEIEKSATLADYYASEGAGFLANTPMPRPKGFDQAYISYRPLGTILSIMPWNFPFWQVIRMAIPTLVAGNTVLLKHSSNVQGCALKTEEILQRALGIDNTFRTLVISSKQVDAVLSHPHVHGVALTGSTEVGRIIASRAGFLLKKAVVELGGSDPYVILPDCDLDAAVESCAVARLVNTGQSCISPKRIIVHKDIYDTFATKLVKRMENIKYDHDFGPLVSVDAKKEVRQQVEKSVADGAKVLFGSPDGGVPLDKSESFFNPIVLGNVTRDVACFREEVFGPLLSLTRAESETDALALANENEYGLGAAVFTGTAKGKQIAEEQLDAGMCFVNDFVRSDPKLPFGGTKQSGLGRECSYFGLLEFVNVKTVCVKE